MQYCEFCKGYKSPRAHHCRKCNRWDLLIWYHFHLFISVEELHLLIFALALKAIELWRLYASSYHKDIDFKVIYSIDPYIPCYKQWKQPYPFLKCTIFFTYFQMCYQDGPPLPMDKHMLWTFQPCQLHIFPFLCSYRMYTCCYYFNMFGV